MTKKDLYIIGAGGLGREVAAMVRHCPMLNKLYQVRAFIDDQPGAEEIDSIPVRKGVFNTLSDLPKDSCCAIAIGDSRTRKRIFQEVQSLPLAWPNLIHSSVRILDPTRLIKGKGIVISPGTTITTGVKIEDFVFVNLHATIGHDVRLERFTSVMPGCNISGFVHCEEASYIGSGAILLNGVSVGQESIVGAGAVVVRSVSPKTKVAGIPATEI